MENTNSRKTLTDDATGRAGEMLEALHDFERRHTVQTSRRLCMAKQSRKGNSVKQQNQARRGVNDKQRTAFDNARNNRNHSISNQRVPSTKMTSGAVTSSTAMLVRLRSPPDRPRTM